MAGPVRTKLKLLRSTSRGFKSRFHPDVEPPALKRRDVRTSNVQEDINRGDRIQAARLRFYPTIDVEFSKVYAGSLDTTDLDKAEDKLFETGFRNGPLAYVEVTERFGPDIGSYWLHIITETGKIPLVENRLGLFRRVKDQIHVVAWRDEEREMIHFGAHREQSAILQPARHVRINDSDARRGVRDFRNKWFDTFGEELPAPLELPEVAAEPAEEQVE